jgi:hypothetical protein
MECVAIMNDGTEVWIDTIANTAFEINPNGVTFIGEFSFPEPNETFDWGDECLGIILGERLG